MAAYGVTAYGRYRGFADSPLEGAGFEPSVPRQIGTVSGTTSVSFDRTLSAFCRPAGARQHPDPDHNRFRLVLGEHQGR